MNHPPASTRLPFPTGAADRSGQAFDIRIARDGAWYHEGAPINRLPLVKLFATVLRRDDAGDFWLVTPAERGRIEVDDAPFVAVELRAEGQGEQQTIAFRTNLDEWVTAGPDHPLRVASDPSGHGKLSEEPAPYILVRDRLEARINRAVFYELVELAVENPSPRGVELGVWSERTFFSLGMLNSQSAEP